MDIRDLAEIAQIVDKLNDTIFEQLGDSLEDYPICLITCANGDNVWVEFLDLTIWDGEYDERKYVNLDPDCDEKEKLDIYLIREVNRIMDALRRIRL